MPRLVKHTTRALHRRANFRPGLEPLEDRCVPAITWVAPGGGDWNDPNNWLDPVSLQHRLPAISQGDTVSLPGGEAFTVSNHAGCVSLSVGGMSTFTILGFAQLTVSESAGFDGSLSLANGLLTVGADFGVDDDLTMSGGSFLNLSATGVNDIGADFVWSSGRLAGGSPANPIQLHNPTTIIGPDLKTLHAFVINHDTVTQVGTATLTTNGGRMTNAVDGTYVLAGDGDFTVQNLTHFVNEGTLHKTSGAGVSSVGGFRSTPTGQVVADTGKVELLMFFNAVSNDLDVVVASGAQVSFTTGPNSAGTAGRFQGTLTASGAGTDQMR